jgi:hypothetical protein
MREINHPSSSCLERSKMCLFITDEPVESTSVDPDDDPSVWEQDIVLLKGFDVFVPWLES